MSFTLTRKHGRPYPVVRLPAGVGGVGQAAAVRLELGAEGLGKVFDLVGRLGGVQRGQVLRGGQRVALDRRRVLVGAQVRRADLVGGRGRGRVLLLQLVGELLRGRELLVGVGLQAAQVEAVLRRRPRQHRKVRLGHGGGGQRRRGRRRAEAALHRRRGVDVLVGVERVPRVGGGGGGERPRGGGPEAQREAGAVAGALQRLQQEAGVLVHQDRLVARRPGGVAAAAAVAHVGAVGGAVVQLAAAVVVVVVVVVAEVEVDVVVRAVGLLRVVVQEALQNLVGDARLVQAQRPVAVHRAGDHAMDDGRLGGQVAEAHVVLAAAAGSSSSSSRRRQICAVRRVEVAPLLEELHGVVVVAAVGGGGPRFGPGGVHEAEAEAVHAVARFARRQSRFVQALAIRLLERHLGRPAVVALLHAGPRLGGGRHRLVLHGVVVDAVAAVGRGPVDVRHPRHARVALLLLALPSLAGVFGASSLPPHVSLSDSVAAVSHVYAAQVHHARIQPLLYGVSTVNMLHISAIWRLAG
ncbi:hypothetical protein EYF80_003696 [Liparis tanakae]|uniref:Uncharacterized protein n=1 Tax=Liparis tanakae TaxID=230148 RepID=A0A4Z2J8R4_9TELE|nr:hypothetical protein EYF80_003696 [Liparis tanakae]